MTTKIFPFVFFSLFISHVVYTQSDLSTCPSNIQTLKHVRVYTDACLLFVEHKLSWDDARKNCRSLGGDLIMVKDSAKQKFILDSLIFEHWNTQNIWIGATDSAKEGDWRWIDGSSVTYAHFADGQGTNHNLRRFIFSDGSNEDCALIRRSDGGLWHDYPCNYGLGSLGYHYTYACEFPKTDMLVQIGSTTTDIIQNINPYHTTIPTVSTQSTTAKAFILTKLVKTGRNVTFSCPITSSDGISVSWYGPPDSRTLYASGTVTNPRLSTIAIVGDHAQGEYNLFISLVTKYDEGHYTCSMTYNGTYQSQGFSLHVY